VAFPEQDFKRIITRSGTTLDALFDLFQLYPTNVAIPILIVPNKFESAMTTEKSGFDLPQKLFLAAVFSTNLWLLSGTFRNLSPFVYNAFQYLLAFVRLLPNPIFICIRRQMFVFA
jgi:hypothetical protein